MKNLYALNKFNALVNIVDVDKVRRDKYFCLQCGDELIARKGVKNIHHFSHKSKMGCNYETYLHKLGKLVFYNTYRDCLKTGKPFYIDFETKRLCNTCIDIENVNRLCEISSIHGKFDLTKVFNEIYLEKFHNGFIADVLLKSSERQEVIFIEIFVTHSCDQGKVNSGIRIVEINVKDESDLNFLFKNHLHHNIENCSFYNFKTEPKENNFISFNKCTEKISFFSIYKNGKARNNNVLIKDLNRELSNENIIYSKILNSSQQERMNGRIYQELVIEASRCGIKFKNCFSCRFYAPNKSDFVEATLFCKKNRAYVINSNDGSTCSKFWRVE